MNVLKICGITSRDEAAAIADMGVSALGFIFYRNSPRYTTPENVRNIVRNMPPFVSTVGVFVNEQPENIRGITEFCSLDWIQLHGDESPEYCNSLPRRIIKAFRVKQEFNVEKLLDYNVEKLLDYSVNAFLLDTYNEKAYGGTGTSFDWEVAKKAKKYGPVILSGGLNTDNLLQALKEVQPYGVDISSGVEKSPGSKDLKKVEEIVRIFKEFTPRL